MKVKEINFEKFKDNVNKMKNVDKIGGRLGNQNVNREEINELLQDVYIILNNDIEINDNLLEHFTNDKLNDLDYLADCCYYDDLDEEMMQSLSEMAKGNSLKDLLLSSKSNIIPKSILFF